MTQFTNCPGSGTKADQILWDICPACVTRYHVTKRGTIRNHVDRMDRMQARSNETHERVRSLIAELSAKYGTEA